MTSSPDGGPTATAGHYTSTDGNHAATEGTHSAAEGNHTAAEGNHTAAGGRRSIGELLSDVSQDVTTLLRQEVALAKAEVRQSVSSAGKGVGMFAGAGVAGHMVLLFLSIAGWWALGDSIGRGWSGLVVALVWLVIAAILAVLGRGELKSVGGVPQTANTIKKIPNAAKGHEEMS